MTGAIELRRDDDELVVVAAVVLSGVSESIATVLNAMQRGRVWKGSRECIEFISGCLRELVHMPTTKVIDR